MRRSSGPEGNAGGNDAGRGQMALRRKEYRVKGQALMRRGAKLYSPPLNLAREAAGGEEARGPTASCASFSGGGEWEKEFRTSTRCA